MFRKLRIQDRELALVSDDNGLEQILGAGTHYLFGRKYVEVCDLGSFPADITDLEWLVATRAEMLSGHLDIAQTGVNEVALICSGQKRHVVGPNSLKAFWKAGANLRGQRMTLPQDLQVPVSWLKEFAPGTSVPLLKFATIGSGTFGLLFADSQFCDYLEPGKHAYFDVLPNTKLVTLPENKVITDPAIVNLVRGANHEKASKYLTSLYIAGDELALFWNKDELMHVAGSTSQVLAHVSLTVETLKLEHGLQEVAPHIVQAARANQAAVSMPAPFVASYEVAPDHVGLLYVDGVLCTVLQPGFYMYWHAGKRLTMTVIDTRLNTLEISGQEMLTQDKVPLRVNVTAGYRIVDPTLTAKNLADFKEFIYKEIQFGLRAAIGARSLDGLLENKNDTDQMILNYVQNKANTHGIAVVSLGIKDLILPGEIKSLLSKVVEAEKAAQANVIRRREETAATRSLLNTSKVMEDNPVALRLKELETLEKITEKIDSISVFGGLEGVLKQLAPFQGSKGLNAS